MQGELAAKSDSKSPFRIAGDSVRVSACDIK